MKAKWREEKELVEKVQNAKAEIENLKTVAERLEREGYGKKMIRLRIKKKWGSTKAKR